MKRSDSNFQINGNILKNYFYEIIKHSFDPVQDKNSAIKDLIVIINHLLILTTHIIKTYNKKT